MSYGSRYDTAYGPVRVPSMYTADDVIVALGSRARPSHEYMMAVMHSYIDIKLSRGKSKMEVGWKLEHLERQLPQLSTQWALVRQHYGLPESRVLPPQSSIRRTASHQPAPPRTYHPERTNGLTVVRVNTTPARPRPTAPAVVRPVPLGDDEELPPPPYTADDPEPDQTRMLEERLAHEAVVEGRVEQEQAYSPPAGPPPRQPTPQASPPQSPPSDADDEVRLVWEESQLDEAKRASRAAEQERKELEEAMRLSLADAEAAGVASSVAGPSSLPTSSGSYPSTPPSHPAGPNYNPSQTGSQPPNTYSPSHQSISFQHGPNYSPSHQSTSFSPPKTYSASQSTNFGPISPPIANTNPRPLPRPRISSPQLAPPPNTFHRRTSSDVGPSFASMSIAEFDPLGDDQSMPSVVPLQPTRTGLKSNNPFLSPGERDPQMSEPTHKPLPPSPGPPPQPLPPPLPPRSASTLVEGEDPLEMLRSCDTVFLIDDSASMAGERWEEAKASLKGVADIAAQYDDDGIDIYFLNSKRVGTELRNSADVDELFEGLVPKGSTPTGTRLDAILQKYLSRLEKAKTYEETVKPLNLIIVTDGTFALPILARARHLASNTQFDRATVLDSAPSDDPEVVLVAAAQRLDRGEFPMSQLGIQFLQIGSEPEATAALRELDDGLSQAHDTRDIVDSVLFSGEAMTASYIIKTLLGGINKRLDRT